MLTNFPIAYTTYKEEYCHHLYKDTEITNVQDIKTSVQNVSSILFLCTLCGLQYKPKYQTKLAFK